MLLLIETAEPPAERTRDGVIEEARRRQRRRRRTAILVVALTALAAALLAPLFYGGSGALRPSAPLQPASSLTPLTGPPLSTATQLELAVSENGSSVFLVDIDHHSARAVPGLGSSPRRQPQFTLQIAPNGSGALATSTHWNCEMWVNCARGQVSFLDRQSQFLIAPSGSVKRLATFPLTRHQYTTPAFASTSTWVQTWPHTGPCTLRLVPGSNPAVRVPCGAAGPDTATGLWIWNGGVAMRVDPVSGRVLQRLEHRGRLTPLAGGMALESSDNGSPSGLALVNLATGARRPLRWPSSLHFGYQVFPAPNGPLVALEFGDPWYPQAHESVNQAADVWVLDTASGAFTHVPGFPALELIKQSSIGWSPDGRLVVAARGGGRTVVGVWSPGQATLPIRTVPALYGYSQFVALRP